MTVGRLITPAVASVLIAGAAFGQDADTLEYMKLDDMSIYGAGGDKIGEFEEVLVDSEGNVVALAVETEGFLDIGSEDVIVGLDQMDFQDDRFVTSLTEDQLEALPKWDD